MGRNSINTVIYSDGCTYDIPYPNCPVWTKEQFRQFVNHLYPNYADWKGYRTNPKFGELPAREWHKVPSILQQGWEIAGQYFDDFSQSMLLVLVIGRE